MNTDVISTINELIFCLLDVVLLYRFAQLSLKKKDLNKYVVFFTSLLTALTAFSMSFISTYSWLSTIILFGSIVIYVVIIFQGRIINKFIASLLYYLILGLLTALISSLAVLIFPITTNHLFENLSIRTTIALAIKLAFFVIVELVRKKRIDISSNQVITSRSFQAFFLLTFVSLIVLFELLYFDVNISNQYLVQYMGVVFVIFFVIVLLALTRYYKSREKMIEMNILLKETQIKKQEAAREVDHNKNLMSVKHDLKNHLIVLKHYIEDSDNAQAIEYIEKMQSLDAFKTYVHSKNQTLNALLNVKISENKDIDFRIRLDIDQFDFDSILLTIVLGNILDNAIEAVEYLPKEQRIVDVIISENKQFGKIVVENPFIKNPKIKNGKLQSLKRDNIAGLGLASVENIIKDYDGIMEYEIKNQIFHIAILLKKHNSHLNIPNSH